MRLLLYDKSEAGSPFPPTHVREISALSRIETTKCTNKDEPFFGYFVVRIFLLKLGRAPRRSQIVLDSLACQKPDGQGGQRDKKLAADDRGFA